MTRKDRFDGILRYFRENVPVAESELHFESPFQLICAVVLSAQCTDKRVNMVTPRLFELYPDARSLAAATPEEVYTIVKSVSYPNSKAAHLVEMAAQLQERFGGEVPSDIDDLMSLPGVGRKTANVIRGNIYHDPSVVVDTHVKRISKRLGLSKSDDPEKVEQELMKVLPKDHWILYNIQIITFGRSICTARSPKCEECFLTEFCKERKKSC